MFLSWRIRVSPPISHRYSPLFNGAIPQREQIPLFRQSELSFWRWSAIPRCRRRLKQNSTMSSMEDFRNIAIFFPFPTSQRSLKKFIGMLVFFQNSFLRAEHDSVSSRWEPVAPLGSHLILSNILITS